MTFDHWNTKADDSGTSFSDEHMFLNATSENGGKFNIYAIWRANTYRVVFHNNGGDGEMDVQGFRYDETKSLHSNTFTREGYVFAGWATTEDAGTPEYADEATLGRSIMARTEFERAYGRNDE